MGRPSQRQVALRDEAVAEIRAGIAAVAATPQAEMARRALAGAERIAVVTKPRFMGDTIVATPFLKQLRCRFPKAQITLLTAPSVVVAFENCPYVHKLISQEIQQGRYRYTRELWRALRAGRFAAAFLLDRSLRCALVTALAGIPVRIGYLNECRRPFLTVPIPYYFDRHEVDCHLDMLRALGLPAEDALPELWVTEEERARAGEWLREQGWSGQRPLIGVQPGANDPQIREWGAERYARVADALLGESGGSVAILGGEAERATGERMARAMQNPSFLLSGQLLLRRALALIGLCDLWIGNDSGLLHAAVAQRVPSVGLYGPNKVARWGYDTPRHRSLAVFPETPATDDAAVRRCLDAITEDMVLEAARAVHHSAEGTCGNAQASENGQRPSPYYARCDLSTAPAPVRRR